MQMHRFLTVCAYSLLSVSPRRRNIDPLLAAGADIVANDLYCRMVVVGRPMVEYKAAIVIATVDYVVIIFRCTIISKCILNLGYSPCLVIIT